MSLEQYINPETGGALAVGLALGGAAVRGYMNSILHDRGHTQLVVPKSHAPALLEIFTASGTAPRRRIIQGNPDDPTIIQAIMGKGGDTVLLSSDESSLEELGNPTCGKTFVSKTPREDAEAAAAIYEEHGISARVSTSIYEKTGDPLYFVVAEGSPILLGWRPHGKDMPGPIPPRWRDGDTL